ncbi:9150_t:CDS:1, partial [Cetraspora pellucida]
MVIITDGLSLASRKSVRDDFTNKIPELKKSLNSITGFDYEFAVDFSKIHADAVKAVPENNEWITKSSGNIAFQYFDSLISNISRVANNDDLVRSDFVKITNNREIHLLTDSDIQDNYNEISIADGNIYIKTQPCYYGTNTGGVGYNILELLKSSDEVLPLVTKTNIRDGWEQQTTFLKKSLKQVLGEDYEFVINWENIYLKAISANEDNSNWLSSKLGEIVYAYFESLIKYINDYAKKDDLVRSELVNVIYTKKFYFVYDEDINDYNAIEVKDGELYIKVKPESLGTNSSIGYSIIDVIKNPNDVLPLRTKKSIRDGWEKEIPSLKKQLNKCLGEDYQFRIDFDEVYMQVTKANEDNTDWFSKSLGNIALQYFSSLTKYIEDYAKKDDLIRQEFLDLTNTKTFHLVMDDDVEDYHDVKIIDGGLYIMVHPARFGTNASPGYDIVERLQAPDSVLSVITKVNIRDQWTMKIPALKKKLKEAVHDEIEFVVDFDNIFETAKKNSDDDGKWFNNKLGEIVFAYFESLVANIIKDDMIRDNFADIVKTKKIYFVFNDEVKDYNDILVKDNALYIRVGPKYLGTNSSNIGYNIIDV